MTNSKLYEDAQPPHLALLLVDDDGNQHVFDIPPDGEVVSTVSGAAYVIVTPDAQPPRPRRGRPPGTPNPNGGRPAMPEEERRQRHTVTLDPDIALLVQWHARARGNSVSESVNILLGEALRHHEVDKEREEVY